MIITIGNQRGGVAKTTSTLNIGAGLHRRGYSVLFIDLDSQCNLSSTLLSKIPETSIIDALKDNTKITTCIVATDEGDMIAGSPLMAVLDKELTGDKKELRLKIMLDTIKSKYDFIVMDTQPSLSLLTISALTASDGVIIPTQADPYSIQGIAQLQKTIEAVRSISNPKLTIMGILVTRYNQYTTIRRKWIDHLQASANSINTYLYQHTIREATSIIEAATLKQSIFAYAPKSKVAQDYSDVVDEILNQLKGDKQ